MADSPKVEPTMSAKRIWSVRGRWRRNARHEGHHSDDAMEVRWWLERWGC
jgi:hypothetical protein